MAKHDSRIKSDLDKQKSLIECRNPSQARLWDRPFPVSTRSLPLSSYCIGTTSGGESVLFIIPNNIHTVSPVSNGSTPFMSVFSSENERSTLSLFLNQHDVQLLRKTLEHTPVSWLGCWTLFLVGLCVNGARTQTKKCGDRHPGLRIYPIVFQRVPGKGPWMEWFDSTQLMHLSRRQYHEERLEMIGLSERQRDTVAA